MSTSEVRVRTIGLLSSLDGLSGRRRVRRAVLRGASSAVALGSVGAVSAQEASGGAATGGGGSGLYVTAAALTLTGLAIGAVYLLSWRDRPEPTFSPATPTEDRIPNRHTGQMYEADVSSRETSSVDHDAFDPVGTGALLFIYFLIIALMWVFMYFVEFLGNGPSVVG